MFLEDTNTKTKMLVVVVVFFLFLFFSGATSFIVLNLPTVLHVNTFSEVHSHRSKRPERFTLAKRKWSASLAAVCW